MVRLRVNLIGMGKVGRSFLTLLGGRTDIEIGDVLSRQHSHAETAVAAVGQGRAVAELTQMRPADLWLLAVPDDQLASLAAQLAQAQAAAPLVQTAVTAGHFSGILTAEVLAPLRGLGWQLGSCHPALSFADPRAAAQQFPGTYCGIEGDSAATSRLADLVGQLGGVPFVLGSEAKVLYHAAAVFSNNFSTVLQAIALEAWAGAGVAPDVAQALCAGLLRSTAENVSRLGPAAALTGPAARGDFGVMRAQAAVVAAWQPEAGQLYQDLSAQALRLKRYGRVFGGDGTPE